jgi:site-specific DNA recombinase
MIAAIYARKSTEQAGVADDQKSVARQLDHARTYATAKGWMADDRYQYVDDGISSAEFANRPGFLRLMNALKPRPPFQVLIMSEESRLGREAIETAYALKQLVTAGVRVFFYLEDRERTFDSPTDKLMMSVTAFADELEREKARQRTYDAMQRKARAGHVTGGRVFGYDNVRTEQGHVERRINAAEAPIVRRVFQLSAEGHGVKTIAKRLNAEGVRSPRAQQGRSQTWAPSSVRAVLHHDVYRGVIAWNRTRKRTIWGQRKQASKPATDWITVPAPHLAIVSEADWRAAHARIQSAGVINRRGRVRSVGGRPPAGTASKYLLTNLVRCGCCGGSLHVRSWSHGKGRKYFYACSGYHLRGTTVCTASVDAPMADTNEIVIEALLDEVLDPSIVRDAAEEAVRLIVGDAGESDPAQSLERMIEKVEQERARLVSAIAAGGQLHGLLSALQAREKRLEGLKNAERQALRSQRRPGRADAATVRAAVMTLANSWRRILAEDPTDARPIITSLLTRPVTITAVEAKRRWKLEGEGTLSGLFQREIFQEGIRPHGIRD